MEITGYDTVSSDAISVTSNPYLKEIETWDERNLPCYKKKVKDRIFSGYAAVIGGVILSYALYAVLLIILGMFGLYETLCDNLIAQWIFLAVFYPIVLFIVRNRAKKTMVEFVDSCHGEIGHAGQPFMRKVVLHMIIAAVLGVAGSVVFALVFLQTDHANYAGLAVLENCYIMPGLIGPFAYFWGTFAAPKEMAACPVCGRFNTVYKIKSSEDFGERQDGSHTEYDYQRERVGTRTITTHYSDGSKTSRDEGIYESVRYTEEYTDYSNLAKYTYLCHECSYAEETVEEKKWKVLRSKYRG